MGRGIEQEERERKGRGRKGGNRRSFPVAESILWNSLPPDIQSSSSSTDFCHKLKTYTCSTNHSGTFCCNYPLIDLALVDSCYSSHVKNSDLIDRMGIAPSKILNRHCLDLTPIMSLSQQTRCADATALELTWDRSPVDFDWEHFKKLNMRVVVVGVGDADRMRPITWPSMHQLLIRTMQHKVALSRQPTRSKLCWQAERAIYRRCSTYPMRTTRRWCNWLLRSAFRIRWLCRFLGVCSSTLEVIKKCTLSLFWRYICQMLTVLNSTGVATKHSVQLDLKSGGTICRWTSDSWTCHSAISDCH